MASPDTTSTSTTTEDSPTTTDRVPLESMTEADEVYERIEDLKSEIVQATLRVQRLDQQLTDLRSGLGDMNDLMDIKNTRAVCHGRLGLIQHALKAAEKKLSSISNSTTSMIVKALASLRTVMYHKLKYKQIQYESTRSERVKRERDETERRLVSTSEALAMERKGQSQSNTKLIEDYNERVEWLVSGDTKNALIDLQSNHFVVPRAFDETARIEKFMVSHRQQGTGAKMILLLKHMQLNDTGVYTVDISHNNLGNWSNLILSSVGHATSMLHTLKLRGCALDDDCIVCLCQYLPSNVSLTYLDVSKNKFTSNGIASLGKCLSGGSSDGGGVCCSTLTKIHVGDNNITNDGTNHSGLEFLSIGLGHCVSHCVGENVGEDGDNSSDVRSLLHVSLVNASIYSGGTKRLKYLNWRVLLSVDLSFNYLTNRGALTLGNEMLIACECLHTLKLKDCFIHDEGFVSLMQGIWGSNENVLHEDNEERSTSLLSHPHDHHHTTDGDGDQKSTHPKKEQTTQPRRRTVQGQKPRLWQLIDLSNNRVTDVGIQQFHSLIHSNKKVCTKKEKRKQRKNRQSRRKKDNEEEEEEEARELAIASCATGWFDSTRKDNDCLDEYRSVVTHFRLPNNALGVKGARLLGTMLVEEGSFIWHLNLDSLLDRKQQAGYLDVNHIKYNTHVAMNGKGLSLLSIVTASELLKYNAHIISVAIRGNHLTTEAASLFTQGMAARSSFSSLASTTGMAPTLRHMDFSYNLINLKNLQVSDCSAT